ncbi:MAG: hypothetical protein ACOVQ6_19500 [Brevundimonas sp.]
MTPAAEREIGDVPALTMVMAAPMANAAAALVGRVMVWAPALALKMCFPTSAI